jgi:hypothetical protein
MFKIEHSRPASSTELDTLGKKAQSAKIATIIVVVAQIIILFQ